MTFADWFSRFALAALVSSSICIPLGFVLLRISGVPPTYPPLLPQQVFSGTFGGSILVALGYALLGALCRDIKTRHLLFFALGMALLLLSFHLPYRLSYTQSPRFAGVTPAAQIGQGLLHTLVVGIGIICFLSEKPGWE